MKFALAYIALFSSLTLAACSFDYSSGADSGRAVPEIVLRGADASRYEDGAVSVTLTAETLEMYAADDVWAGERVSFTQFDRNGNVASDGSAGLLLVDNAAESYSLGNGLLFHVWDDDLFFRASDLQWSKKTHRLSGGAGETVSVEKSDGTELRGKDFFADTLARTYRFASGVEGKIVDGNGDEE